VIAGRASSRPTNATFVGWFRATPQILFAALLVVLLAEIVRRMVESRYGAEYAARGLA
jgi:hypothetical protein